ncbi:hypothetical protein C1637_15175 [Chryseobacterium lactis]|uniref:Lipocalin-like domain-containing protein n=1 Tax=Chryseobacterium lactis TaxID=1241981 RepID=A0A3G6RL25_CHRLC|nr:hypothetical protein [Chryseobacterium lactis]AZA83544.1 hypothetical protein EG342_17390 [Chryseobacterium lactis]AZB03929.1 hypothetical protein EG341_08265 [Chryseobacterium lactis]PNW13162.1 hypothetical protein C1637_15175 [Chryseobacterium lactis]
MKKTVAFPFFIVILVILFSCKGPERKKLNFPNNLKSTRWIINAGGLIAPVGEKTYYLSKRIDTAFILNFHAVDFLDAEKFKSYDSWECGNDCFTEIHGRYYFTEKNQIQMEVDSISTSGTCDAPTKIFKPAKNMSFNLMKEGEHLKLTRK